MTGREAYRIHKNAARSVGRGKGYKARGLDEALKVLEPFWKENGGGVYVTWEMVDKWDKEHAAQA